ncbi:MAG TPA: hypothetical protein V6D00_01145 [Pantanalinema sp.]
MERRHVINLQGQEFVTYEGLLNEAHQLGLQAIRTHLVQLPAADNGHLAVVTAEVELEGGKVFTGIGDASTSNVGPAIARHLVRMAETRAKARALRDAVNIGMTALEELGELEQAPTRPASTPEAHVLAAAPGRLATPKQINKVAAEMARAGWSDQDGRDYLIQRFNKLSRSELTTSEISLMIDHLIALPDKKAAV